ncbi:ABC transporter substrate-binding protein [Geobacter hydrogenophilus]|uniref:Organic solvent tolerance ABC transporter substrate-binding protein n=1 Tax=Geobacter hydrogenophilus TaxID=40983 RepID=A0A9W6G4E5_9BACT|nr:ABC transporter substrate-binding protein [Geobacter hydrogenophilus]MBT0892705.1 ABC transporter substrate-binding protein [Geobacter hydrogenophilus]GLI40103.1 organic solvent tolerance ABC transporter substrate-binding protein [Geobacter hydrogenophilus]
MKWFALPILFITFALGGPAFAQGVPTQTVKKTVDEVVRIVSDKEMKKPQFEKKRRQELKKAIGAVFDYGEMAQRAMARHWKDRNAAEKKEFVSLFETLLENSYADKIESYNQEKIVYLNERIEGEYAEVRSKVVTAKRDEYSLDYRLMNKGGKWMAYDVVIEGVSLVSNYRGQFNKIITNEGYPALLKKLKSKSAEIKAP